MMAAVVERENMKAALRRVEANKGAAGVDGMTVAALRPYLMEHWPRIKAELLAGRYQPSPVRGVEIPKPGGGMRRKLRCMLWRQWKRNYTRAKNLMKRGLGKERAFKSATNGRGPWWNAGASHMNEAFPKRFFDRLGLVSMLNHLRQLHYTS